MEAAIEGIRNLINNCAELKRGESVLLLNELGSMESELVTLIAETVKEMGASYHIMWAEPLERGAAALSPVLVGAIQSADKVIAHYPLRDSVLAKYPGEVLKVRVIHSMFRTLADFASEHARFHWGMAKAIYDRFENELFAVGRKWRITTPVGTDLAGVIGPVSERARQLEDDRALFSRSFNTPAFIPVATLESNGKAVVEYAGGFQRIPIDNPPTIIIEDNVMVRVEGPPEAKAWIERYATVLDERAQQFGPKARSVDSWHGGLHPRADCVVGLIGNASTKMLHFHMAPEGAHIAAQMGDLTLELDGEKLLEGGKYAPDFDDPKLREAARSFGLEHWR